MAVFVEKKRSRFFGLPLSFTKYTISDEILTVRTGLLTIKENDCYIYKIQDVTFTQTLMERIFKLSTIICYTGDTTDPELKLTRIRNGREIREYLVRESDAQRIKRRTINTLNIDANSIDLDGDGNLD